MASGCTLSRQINETQRLLLVRVQVTSAAAHLQTPIGFWCHWYDAAAKLKHP